MELREDEVLGYLGAGAAGEALRLQVREVLSTLSAAVTPRYVYRLFPLEREGDAFLLTGTPLRLTGSTARLMLSDCTQAAVLSCTLGAGFDELLRREQVRDMARAAILDACGGAWVEAGCDQAEEELRRRLPGSYLTDRFSPGYGDLPLSLQRQIGAVLDLERRLGVHISDSMMMNPVKSVTAFIGISPRPQMARVRGCAHCTMAETCTLRKGGKSCGI